MMLTRPAMFRCVLVACRGVSNTTNAPSNGVAINSDNNGIPNWFTNTPHPGVADLLHPDYAPITTYPTRTTTPIKKTKA